MNLNKFRPVVAITGSAGKTMVKTMTAAILSERWVIFESKDYYNTFQHTAEHAKQISYIHRAAVLEYGMAFEGVITKHCSYIQPNIAVITNVLSSHIGNLGGDINRLIAAKGELISGMDQNGVLFLNADDEHSKLLDTSSFSGEIITVGFASGADIVARNILERDGSTKFRAYFAGQSHEFIIPTVGRHNVYNALFAIGVANYLGFSPDTMAIALKKMKKPNHRLNVIKLRDNITVIDDTVHAAPDAMRAAIDVLMKARGRRKIAILGTMTELGQNSKIYHRQIGEYLVKKKVNKVYIYGGYSVNIGEGAVDIGYTKENIKHFREAQLADFYDTLKGEIRPSDTILVKGASGLNMYKIVKFLCKQYSLSKE